MILSTRLIGTYQISFFLHRYNWAYFGLAVIFSFKKTRNSVFRLDKTRAASFKNIPQIAFPLGIRTSVQNISIFNFLKSHNTPLLAPKLCIGVAFDFSWDIFMSEENSKTDDYAEFLGVNKSIIGFEKAV